MIYASRLFNHDLLALERFYEVVPPGTTKKDHMTQIIHSRYSRKYVYDESTRYIKGQVLDDSDFLEDIASEIRRKVNNKKEQLFQEKLDASSTRTLTSEEEAQEKKTEEMMNKALGIGINHYFNH